MKFAKDHDETSCAVPVLPSRSPLEVHLAITSLRSIDFALLQLHLWLCGVTYGRAVTSGTVSTAKVAAVRSPTA